MHGAAACQTLLLTRPGAVRVRSQESIAADPASGSADAAASGKAWWAVAEDRADLAVAGGADSLVAAAALFGDTPVGEGAAFVVFRAAGSPEEAVPEPDRSALTDPSDELGQLGAATWPVAFVRAHLRAQG